MPVTCVLNFDHVSLAQRERVGSLICGFPEARWPDAQSALMVACGFGSNEVPE